MPKVPHTNGQASEEVQYAALQRSANGHAAGNGRVLPGREVLPLANDPNLIQRIVRDLAAIGLVGEERNGVLVYIAYTSRKLNEPLSVIIRGLSASGKDTAQRKPARLMPPDDVIEGNSITPNALYYGSPGWLSHKIVLGGERSHQDDDATRDKTAAIRQMISQGYLMKVTTKVNAKGEIETTVIRQDGPIAYSETTTKESIFAEDSNRCLQLYTDDSEQVTRNVMLAVANRYSPSTDTNKREEEIVREHHELQRSLEYVDVRVPYARQLAQAMPARKIEARRFFAQVMATIEAIAFLHQHQRPRDDQDRLLATLADYEIARWVLLAPLQRSMGFGADFDKCKELIAVLPNREFDGNEALKFFSSRVARDRALNSLETFGVLVRSEKGKSHQPAKWRWSGKSLDELILPTVETLRHFGTEAQR